MPIYIMWCLHRRYKKCADMGLDDACRDLDIQYVLHMRGIPACRHCERPIDGADEHEPEADKTCKRSSSTLVPSLPRTSEQIPLWLLSRHCLPLVDVMPVYRPLVLLAPRLKRILRRMRGRFCPWWRRVRSRGVLQGGVRSGEMRRGRWEISRLRW